ncbi:hypothetical protein NDU88_000229 [Pleurodeles waltl]|uniref:GST N-terminal domain-containing protein n=1 Tax=Pleurodeles waltl TaxID=8319 RepID=A0AAV7MHA3_PLEWA|nr:hypothetical protein NDU88_000229 [Pleurodeles waltl]
MRNCWAAASEPQKPPERGLRPSAVGSGSWRGLRLSPALSPKCPKPVAVCGEEQLFQGAVILEHLRRTFGHVQQV